VDAPTELEQIEIMANVKRQSSEPAMF
jgi:hypothetical protein